MRNLYGTRSIVPNNYSFTFDKIYYEEVPTTLNDGILIGRSVLYHPDKTVYLKTADGYKLIAKLDNTERLIRNEGMVLLPEHNVSSINYLSGDGATYNGDGLYILNYEDLKTESDGETENSSYKKVSTNSVYDANIIYFTKKGQEQYVQTICRNNYKTIEKENDSIYCNYFVTGSDNNYLYPLYVLEDNSFLKNISLNNLFYKNGDIQDCGFITSLSGSDNISLKTLMLMKQNDIGGKYYSIKDVSSLSEYEVLAKDKYYSKENENTYKKINLLSDETVYYTYNDEIFNLISSASPETQIKAKYDLYIYYLLTTNNGDENKKGYFIYEVPSSETEEWKLGTNFPYVLINNNDNYVNNRKEGILYFLSKEDENTLKSWPSIRGIPKEDYLKNSVFLLEQRSNRIIEDKTNIVTYKNLSDLPNNVPNLYCYTNNNGIITKRLISNTAENWHLAKAAENKSIGVPAKLNVEMYLILTDITMCTNTDGKIIKGKLDKDTNRKELYHNNKTFIRKGKRVYIFSGDGQGAIDEDTSKVFYKYDPADRHGLIEVPKNSNLSDTSIYVIDKDSSSWGDWEDITEQYTGYIGDLDPYTLGKRYDGINGNEIIGYEKAKLPYNKYTQYYDENGNPKTITTLADFDNSCTDVVSSKYYVKTNANRGNLNNSNTLVEATNTLDEIIGSKTRLYGTQVNQITQGSLSKALAKDYRPYSIPENDIMDTLVHHDADIGAIESLSNTDIKDENGNIIVSNNTYNLTFTKQNKQPDNIDSSNNNTVKVRSLTDAIVKTDNIIGHVERIGRDGFVNKQLHSKKKITGTGSGLDERYYNIEEQNLIDTIVHHDADIGCIEKINTLSKQLNHLGTHNLNFVSTGDYTYLDNENSQISDINSLTEAIVKLDNMVGYLGRLNANNENGDYVNTNSGTQGITGTGNTKEDDTENNQIFSDARPYDIPETTVIDTLVHHDADIGAIEDLKARKGSGNNTNNLNFTTVKDPTDTDKLKGVNDIQSIKDALIILDNLIGARRRLDAKKLQTDDNTLIDILNINDERPVTIPEENVIDAIIHHDADIGSIEELSGTSNTYNLTFTTLKEKPINIDSSNNSVVNVRSLTDAIEKEDNMIGYIGRLGANSTVNGNGHSKGITGTGKDGDARPYNIPETNIIDTLVHHDADIGTIENINRNKDNSINRNLVFTKNTIADNKHEIHSLTDAITILDNIIGNYDGIENEKLEEEELEPNLKNYNADLVTAINHLSKSVVGYKSGLNNDKNLNTEEKRDTLVTAINTLDNILGKFDKAGTNNLNLENITTFISAIKKLDSILGVFDVTLTNNLNLENIKTFISAIKKLDTLLGTINAETIGSESVSKQIQSINSSISKINTVLEKYLVTDLMSYIKNLAENVDVLDVTIHNMMNEQSLMEWGTF